MFETEGPKPELSGVRNATITSSTHTSASPIDYLSIVIAQLGGGIADKEKDNDVLVQMLFQIVLKICDGISFWVS